MASGRDDLGLVSHLLLVEPQPELLKQAYCLLMHLKKQGQNSVMVKMTPEAALGNIINEISFETVALLVSEGSLGSGTVHQILMKVTELVKEKKVFVHGPLVLNPKTLPQVLAQLLRSHKQKDSSFGSLRCLGGSSSCQVSPAVEAVAGQAEGDYLCIISEKQHIKYPNDSKPFAWNGIGCQTVYLNAIVICAPS